MGLSVIIIPQIVCLKSAETVPFLFTALALCLEKYLERNNILRERESRMKEKGRVEKKVQSYSYEPYIKSK